MVNVIGLGYIGLPTALMLAAHGTEVIGTDLNKEIIEKLSRGEVTFKEAGLEALFKKAVESGIRFTTDYQVTDTYIVSVPTPYDSSTKKVDGSYVEKAVEMILDVCKSGTVIIIESTISPGTIDKKIRPLLPLHGFSADDIHLVHAPERIIPGNMIEELLHNDRTIGSDDTETGEKVRNLYASFCGGEIVLTDIRTAELTKVVENTYRAVNIAFANELAKLCQYEGIDVYEIIRICNMHPRVNILQPGPGVGGHCISVDPWFLVGDYPHLARLTKTAMEINSDMPEFVLKQIYKIMKEKGMSDTARVGLYGLTYKENVDDTREAPSLQLLHKQRTHLGNQLKVYDPYVTEKITANQYFDFREFLNQVDFVVIMVKHDHIKENMELLRGKIILDCQNICTLPDTYYL